MPLRAIRPASRWALALLIFLLAALAACSVPGVRHGLLRAAGHALVLNDPTSRADVIVIAADSDGAGVLEAADLIREGVAPQIALFTYQPDRADRELARRGAPTVDPNTLTVQQLRALGVRASIEQIPGLVAGTTDEGKILGSWCRDHGIRTLMFVSTPDHSRRARRVLHRALADYGTRVIVHASHYAEFDPDTWWQTRGGRRTELTEAEKLLLDFVRHPLS